MRVLFQMLLMLVIGGSALSASSGVSPQDSAFLDLFNENQKVAIYRYISEELGLSTGDINSGCINEDKLKQLFAEHLGQWNNKFGKNIHKSLPIKQEGVLDFTNFEKTLVDSFTERKLKSHCANSISISECDIGSRGYVIRKPGHYRICTKGGVLYWKPSRIANLITIDADNVILDLEDNTIIQKSNSTFASSAINILPGHKNITIRNGSLVGFTADAIFGSSVIQLAIENLLITDNINRSVYDPSLVFGSINLQTALNVILKNINITRTTVSSSHDVLGAGILLFNTGNFLVENCNVAQAEVDAGTLTQCVGISTILSASGVIRNCNVSDCNSSGIMPGFGYVFTQNIKTENCIANYNTGIQTTSGYYPQLSDSLQFINCDAHNNHSICQDCHGFPYFISSNGYISNCRAFNNAAQKPTGGFNEKTTGFEMLVCRNCVIEDCEASNNIATNPIRHYAAGFANGNSENIIYRNCISIGNTAIGNNSRGIGFGPALDPRFFGPCYGTIWENCIAEANFGDTQSIGFDLFGQIDSTLIGSISQNHGTPITPNGIGILSNGPYDEGNPVDVPCNVVPIVVMTNNAGDNVLVKSNIVTNNNFAGIMDTTSANNVYIDNTAFNNGTNYVGPIFATGTPIRDWTVQSAPSTANNNGVVGDKLDNMNINNPP